MLNYNFRLIDSNDISEMSELLVARQNLESSTFPSLNNSCLIKIYVVETLQKLFEDSTIIGLGAFNKSELVGYVFGEVRHDSLRGRDRHIWVPYEGIAIRADQSQELIRELYANVATFWLKQGCFNHYALLPLGNQAYIEAFQRLSFYIDHVHGCMKISDYVPFDTFYNPSIRLAGPSDRDAMATMSSIIYSSLNSSPTFSPVVPEVATTIKEGYQNLVENDEVTVLISENESQVLGFQVYEPTESDLMTPDNCVELSIAGICSHSRGKGISKKMTNEGLKLMSTTGYNYVISDWKISNLSASIFWPKCGFIPYAYRVARTIDKNISWANLKEGKHENTKSST